MPDAAQSLPPTTTVQEDVTLASQRKINLIWEVTQALIALSVVLANIALSIFGAFYGGGNFKYPESLTSALFLIVGFYFSRTNHAAVGGIGTKKSEPYVGR